MRPPHALKSCREQSSVSRRTTSPVVVEEHEHVGILGPQIHDALCPLVERAPLVAGDRDSLTFVEAEITPLSGPPERRARPAQIRQAQRRVITLEDRANRPLEPGRVPRLERHAHRRGERAQHGLETLCRDRQRRRQLHQDRTELAPQVLRSLQQPMDGLLRLAQAPDVGHVPARLQREHEVLWGGGGPTLERCCLGQPIERVVHLDRGKARAIDLKPAAKRELAWIERALPMPVLPAGGPNPHADAPILAHGTMALGDAGERIAERCQRRLSLRGSASCTGGIWQLHPPAAYRISASPVLRILWGTPCPRQWAAADPGQDSSSRGASSEPQPLSNPTP